MDSGELQELPLSEGGNKANHQTIANHPSIKLKGYYQNEFGCKRKEIKEQRNVASKVEKNAKSLKGGLFFFGKDLHFATFTHNFRQCENVVMKGRKALRNSNVIIGSMCLFVHANWGQNSTNIQIQMMEALELRHQSATCLLVAKRCNS